MKKNVIDSSTTSGQLVHIEFTTFTSSSVVTTVGYVSTGSGGDGGFDGQ
ncbi:hypothetical protein [uncultured Bacteroides sp.]|nr:hypothetical protein [uncultured Bacteroides sp.]